MPSDNGMTNGSGVGSILQYAVVRRVTNVASLMLGA